MTTPRDFAIALINRLGVPRTDNNLISLVAFESIEGGHWHNIARYNPFNTHVIYGGSRGVLECGGDPNCVHGVQAYDSWAHGVEGAAKTFEQANMKLMLDALKNNAPPNDFFKAINATHAWGIGDYAAILGNGQAQYKNYGNQDDSISPALRQQGPGGGGGGLPLAMMPAAGVDWKTIAVAGGAVVVAGGVAWWLTKRYRHGGAREAQENPKRRRRYRRAA